MAIFLLWLFASAVSVPPGYVDDARCGNCHPKQAESYRAVAMSHAFYRPTAGNVIEKLDQPFFHDKSKQFFAMTRRGGKLVFSRWQTASDGQPINRIEQPVDWILGSGNHARTYLYRTPSGELFQLPINWYTQTKTWAMAPGYDRPDHDGLARRVRHECMFCHNAYPRIAEDATGYWRSQSFPENLPEGLGCQRCHGPGANHVRAADSGTSVAGTIVNPGRLDVRRRNDVCYECHMQASVALPSIRRFGRDIYSFRPGSTLADYMIHLDVDEPGVPRSDRFEINHHPYRLEQSVCFRRSAGRLSCLSCHDPHRKVAKEDRAAHYRRVCLSCHEALVHEPPVAATADCTTCHMPERRTQDVVRVTMTDHRIGRTSKADLLAPRAERDPVIDDVVFLDPNEQAGDIYRASMVLRAGGGTSRSSLARLEKLIAESPPDVIEPYLDLAFGQFTQRRFADLEKTASNIVERDPKNAQALEWLGIARIAGGKSEDGLALIEKALKLDPSRAQTHFNLGRLLAQRGRTEEAIPHLERATRLRPNLAVAWFHLGESHATANRLDAAIDAYRRALEVEPRFLRVYPELVKALRAAGRDEEAMRYEKHAAASP